MLIYSLLDQNISTAITIDQVKIYPDTDRTSYEELPYRWKLHNNFTFPKTSISKWNKSHFIHIKNAIDKGNIQAEYCLREPIGAKEKPSKDCLEGRKTPDFSSDGEASDSPDFDWEKDGPRIRKKVERRIRRLNKEELSEWESGSTAEEEDLTELKREFRMAMRRRRRRN